MEPPSPLQALGVNPFPSRFIIRTIPRGDIQPLTSDVLRVLLFIAYFISLSSTIQVAHVLK